MPEEIYEYLKLVDNRLQDLSPKNIRGLERLLKAAGKKWRPALLITIAQSSGKPVDERVINLAAATELIHLASLIHDDIMDSGELRHSVPTINAREGLDSAILAGDYLIAKGCLLAASVSAEAAKMLADTITVLCEGQAIELADEFNTKRTTESLLAAIKGKTSSMFMVACGLGALVADLNDKDKAALSDYSENLGIAYQYSDDLSDLIESPVTTGKSVGKDILEGKYTFPVILSLEGPNNTRLKNLLQKPADSMDEILEILEMEGSLDNTKRQVDFYKQKSLQALDKLEEKKLADTLAEILHKF